MSKYLELPWSVEDTIENMRKLKEVLQKMCITDNLDGRGENDAEEIAFDFDRAIKALEEIQTYRAIGAPEECRAAVKKQKAVKPINVIKKPNGIYAECQVCGQKILKMQYCTKCGRKLDWSDEE